MHNWSALKACEQAIVSRAGRARSRWRAVARALIVVGLASLVAAVAGLDGSNVSTRIVAAARLEARAPNATVIVSAHARVTRVPRSFLGLSMEYWGLPRFERRKVLLARVLSLLHAPGSGPLLLRVGGDSADHAFWSPRYRALARWAFALTPAWLRETSWLVRRAHMRLILDLNLITGSAARAAAWARAAEAGLPRGSVAALEVGNEPDIYSRRFWRTAITHGSSGVRLPASLSPRGYVRAFSSYARSVGAAAPSVPLIGPALANPSRDVGWISQLLAREPSGLRIVSAHRYPLSACEHNRSSRYYPTIARLLGEFASAGVARSIEPALRAAQRAGLPFRLTELNSVTCGGRAGVSNTFATALWAPDVLFELLRTGVDGVNVHVRANAINGAFTLGRRGLVARPLLYGMAMFARALGPDARLVRLRLSARRSLHLKAWAVQVADRELHVLVIDKGARGARVALRLPATGTALVGYLRAPSPRSLSGVTLDGQWLGRDGRWHGRPVIRTIAASGVGYGLTLAPTSAALVSVRLRPGALSPDASQSRQSNGSVVQADLAAQAVGGL
ncbi:MAG: glycosyl hydrolase family 79 C-terminal domain-containing protein [Solirubrobacteraceae bacterium]